MSSPILPPFTLQSATKKVKLAQALWNTTDHVKVATAYTPSSTWRNRGEFAKGTKEIESLLQKKWEREQDYVLRKEVRLLSLSFFLSLSPSL
jgi:nuclear transport factor 2 (NTF2) superfamily protein